MPTEIERLQVSLEVTQRRFERQLANAERKASQRALGIEKRFGTMNDRVGRSLRNTAASFGGVGQTLLAGLSVREVTRYADAWTVAGNKIAAASEISGTQARSLTELNDIARETRSSIVATTDLYAKLLRATKGVAESEEEVARATELVNKAFKAGGAASSEQFAGILQLSQGLSSGILQGDELRSIRENAPLVAQAIADEFGVTIGELKKLGAEGELTSNRVFQAILNAQKPIEAAFAETNATIGESFTILRNAITEYVGDGDRAFGVSAKIATALNGLADNIQLVAAAGVALGARFIGPVLLGSLVRAVPAILASATALRGLGAGATVASSGLAIASRTIGLFGGPLGALVTGLTVLPFLFDDTADKIKNLEGAGNDAITALTAYADATRKAGEEQEKLGGLVNAATQEILNQTRANLQQSLTALREEYAELKAELEDGIVFNSDTTSLGQNLLAGSGSNDLLSSLGSQLVAVGDGAGDVAKVSSELERLAGVGDEATEAVERYDFALKNAISTDFTAARDELVSLARTLGGFEEELASIDAANTFSEQAIAANALKNAVADAAQAGSILRTEENQQIRETLAAVVAQEDAINAVELALRGEVEEAEKLINPIEESVDLTEALVDAAGSVDFSSAASEAARLADQLGRAVDNSAKLANASISDLRRSEIELNFNDDDIGRASALARERFDASIGDVSGGDSTVLSVIEDRRRAYVAEAVAIAENEQALKNLRSTRSSSTGSGGGGSSVEQVDIFSGVDGDIAELQFQLETLGKSSTEVAKLRTQYELLNLAAREGIDVDAQRTASGTTLRQEIELQAEAVARLSEQYAQAKIEEQAIESGLQSISSTLVNATDSWESFGDAAVNALKRIILEYAQAQVFDGLSGLFGGGGGSTTGGTFLGALGIPGFATGTNSAPGGLALVGERGPELVNLPKGSQVIPNSKTEGMLGGTIEVVVSSDAGSVVEVVQNTAGAMIRQNNDTQNKALPSRIQQIQQDPRKR